MQEATPTQTDTLQKDSLAVGRSVTFTKTVAESDIYLFGGISGDLGPNHCDEEYMKKTRYGRRIAHGVLIIGFMSTCSTKIIELAGNQPTVSYGYDKVRFVRPVFINDTISVTYTVASRDETQGKIWSDVVAKNQHGDVVAVATHILRQV
jgi:acyl dehydratase